MDEDALPGDILPPNASATPPHAGSLPLTRRIARGSPSTDLQTFLHGPIGEAVAEAACYADDAIAASTRAVYLQAWAHFAIWCRSNTSLR